MVGDTHPLNSAVSTSNAPLALQVEGLSKSFGPTQALRSCSFDLRRGEVHALLGENGSGKSTLVKILNGVHRPDEGSIKIGGITMPRASTPRTARAAGIATVFQEILVVPGQSILENIWLGSDTLFRDRLHAESKRRAAAEILEALLGTTPDLESPVHGLPLSGRQVCVIARALVRQPQVLILDEATSSLDIETRDRLLAVVRGLSVQGVATIFISHRMDEIQEIPDRVTVLRGGRTVATVIRSEASASDLVRLMIGADHVVANPTAGSGTDEGRKRPPVLRGEHLRLRDTSDPFDVTVFAGERVGIAGLEGHGQERFLRVLACLDSPSEGIVLRDVANKRIHLRSFAHAAKNGVAYVPRDRKTESIFEALSIRDNFAIATNAEDVAGGVILSRRTDRRLSSFIRRMAITIGHSRDLITTLSGGNQQKIVMARWLATDPKVLLLNDPTRGVDHGAKRDIYALLSELANSGVAVVMLSSEVDELVDIMDRVLVFREGALFREIARADLTRSNLVSAFFGDQSAAQGTPGTN